MDLGDSWEHADNPRYPQQFSALGIRLGVNYIDAFGRCLNVALPDGRPMTLKRRGLQLTLTLGDQRVTTLLDRWAGQDQPVRILELAMGKLAEQLGYRYRYDNRQVVFED